MINTAIQYADARTCNAANIKSGGAIKNQEKIKHTFKILVDSKIEFLESQEAVDPTICTIDPSRKCC